MLILYERIKNLCNQQNLSIMELEKKAGLGNGVVGRWRESDPQTSSLIKVAEALKVSVSDLIGELDA